MGKGLSRLIAISILVVIVIAVVGIILFLRPERPFDFSISAKPNSGSVLPGKSATTIVKAILTSGSKEAVSFSCSNLPSGASCKFSRPKCSPTCGSAATITSSASTQPGTYEIKISATGGGKTKTTTFLLTVISVAQPSLSVTANPATITTSQSATITAKTSDAKSGVLISFSTDIGSLSQESCTTDATGKCSVTFTSSTAGTAIVLASAPGYNSGSTSVVITLLNVSSKPLLFGGWIRSVSYDNIYSATVEKIDVEMQRLDDLGADFYSIHPNYDPFLRGETEKIELLDYVVEQAKSKGKLVHIADSAAESWRTNKITVEEFKSKFVERSTVFIERWEPWAYEILHEPNGWMEGYTTDDITPEQWADIAKAVTANVKEVHPSTVTLHAFVVTADDMALWGDEVKTMRLTLEDSNLDDVGFDIYGKRGEDDKTPLIEPYLAEIRDAGKKLWIPETWGRGGKVIEATGEDATTDVAWADHIIDWCITSKCDALVWFFTMLFGQPGNYTETFYGIKAEMGG